MTTKEGEAAIDPREVIAKLRGWATWSSVESMTHDLRQAADLLEQAQRERKQTRQLLTRADSYLSLLWHRHVPPDRKDSYLSFEVARVIGDLRSASRPQPPTGDAAP